MNPNPENNNTYEGSKPYKLRYKGIENFLRRVAFNLGNSPSQTEVKIISCIPIDVTDLQNKIINLERQLDEARNYKGGSTKNVPVHTALINSTLPNSDTVLTCKCSEVKLVLENDKRMISECDDESSKVRKSAVSFLFPSWSATGLLENTPSAAAKNEAVKETPETNNKERHINFFRRGKKKKAEMKKKHTKNHLVYYAHTENTPFNLEHFERVSNNDLYKNYSKTNVKNILSKAYLANVIQRHFDPKRVVEEFSDTSHFTSPVCRDFPTGHCPYESDVCSCCHGQFQNVDKYMGMNQNFIIEPIKTQRLNKNIYYDSNHYDIIPVKEKAFKAIREETLSKKVRQVPMQCWPEDVRSKPCYQVSVHNKKRVPNKPKNHKKPMTHLQENKINVRIKSPERVKKDFVDHGLGPTDTSNSCCVDCSDVYTKPLITAHNNRKVESTQPKFLQNAECLTIDVSTNKLAITRSIQIDINSTENKTEETLNQIKSMLQSVLAEVKTNPQVNNIQVEKPKKDATIQNGLSQTNIQTNSSFLHSFTYNSYDTNPYIPGCSRQIPSNFCYTNFPYQRIRCHQHFPLLHSPGHRICGCLNKNSGHNSKPKQGQATTTATNTEMGDAEDNAKETDKLIKEIYKSLALTMDIPKDTSNSEYDELKSTSMESAHKNVPKRVKSTIVAMSSVQKRDIQVEASITPLSTTTVQSKHNNNSVGTISDTNETEVHTSYESQTTDVLPMEELLDRPKAKVASTISEHDSEDLSSDYDGDEIIEEKEYFKETEKTEKKGLLRRMLGSVKLFNKTNQIKAKAKQVIKQVTDDEQSESDSDEYQTIYSERSNKKSHPIKRRLNKPGTYQIYRPHQQRVRINRKSPYMEQEYRRQWEENLIFQENRGRRYSSERPFSVQKTPTISPYWQNYEARSAIIDNTPYTRKMYSPGRNTVQKVEKRTSISFADKADRTKLKNSWLKRHKLGIHCGEQWKKFILEN